MRTFLLRAFSTSFFLILPLTTFAEGMDRFGSALLGGKKDSVEWWLYSNAEGTVLSNTGSKVTGCRFFTKNEKVNGHFRAKPVPGSDEKCTNEFDELVFELRRDGDAIELSFPSGQFLSVKLAPTIYDFSTDAVRQTDFAGVPLSGTYSEVLQLLSDRGASQTSTTFSKVPGYHTPNSGLDGRAHLNFDTIEAAWSDQSFDYRVAFHFAAGLGEEENASRRPIAAFAEIRPLAGKTILTARDGLRWARQLFGKPYRLFGYENVPIYWVIPSNPEASEDGNRCSTADASSVVAQSEAGALPQSNLSFASALLPTAEERCDLLISATINIAKGQPVRSIQLSFSDPGQLGAYAFAVNWGEQLKAWAGGDPNAADGKIAKQEETQAAAIVENSVEAKAETDAVEEPWHILVRERTSAFDLSEADFGETTFYDPGGRLKLVFSPEGNYFLISNQGSRYFMFSDTQVDGLFMASNYGSVTWFGLSRSAEGDIQITFPGKEFPDLSLKEGVGMLVPFGAPDLSISGVKLRETYSEALSRLSERNLFPVDGAQMRIARSGLDQIRLLAGSWEQNGFLYNVAVGYPRETVKNSDRPPLFVISDIEPSDPATAPYMKDVLALLRRSFGEASQVYSNSAVWSYAADGVRPADANRCNISGEGGELFFPRDSKPNDVQLKYRGFPAASTGIFWMQPSKRETEQFEICRYLIEAKFTYDSTERLTGMTIRFGDVYSAALYGLVQERLDGVRQAKSEMTPVPQRSPFGSDVTPLPSMD